MGPAKCCCALGVAAWLVAADARAAVTVAPEVAFTEPELSEALALRLDAPPDVRVDADGAGRVAIRVGEKGRVVDLEGRTGAAAARLVALAVADLAAGESIPLDAPVVVDRAPVAAKGRTPLSVLAVPMMGLMTDDAGPVFGGSVGVTLGLGGAWHVSFDGGLAVGGVAEAPLLTTALRVIPVRAALAWRRGAVEVRGGVTVASVHVVGGLGDDAILGGAGASVLFHVPFADSLGLVAAIGVDAFANRVIYEVDGMESFATARVGEWVGLGLAWEVP